MSIYELYYGDTKIGFVHWKYTNQPWHHGCFEPLADYAQVKAVFENELSLLDEDEANAKWTKAWEDIEAVGLTLKNPVNGEEISQPLIHIDGTEAWWRY